MFVIQQSFNIAAKASRSLTAGVSLALTLGLGAASLHSPAQAQAQAATGKTELYWFGQAGFKIKTPGGKTIVIDPWLTGGPKTPAPYKTDISAIGKVASCVKAINR